MPEQTDASQILVLAPSGRDYEGVRNLLRPHNLETVPIASLDALASTLGDATGAVVLTEEALAQADWSSLLTAVTSQPSWSAYPFILIVSQSRSSFSAGSVYALLPPEISNVMVLERPMSTVTLVSAVNWALGGRHRQFITRAHLEELEENQEQQRLLTRELAHRVKNTIAVLQSIVTQTMRPHPEADGLRIQLVERFAALGRAHDLLLSRDFRATDLETLARASLSIHLDSQDRITVSGPPIMLSAQASLSLALVLHELATNALKYGALSHRYGKIRVEWSVDSSSVFHFTWEEQGGPPALPPTRKGFGSKLISATLNSYGLLEQIYGGTGLLLRFRAPVGKLLSAADPDPLDG